MILLQRFNYGINPDISNPVSGTFGILTLPSGNTFYTVERPWIGNRPFESCIPDGLYKLRKRESNAVKNSTGGEFTIGWEVTGVPERTYIMFHPASFPHQLEGCISVGKNYGLIPDHLGTNRLGVKSSRNAFRELMYELTQDEYTLFIHPFVMEYP